MERRQREEDSLRRKEVFENAREKAVRKYNNSKFQKYNQKVIDFIVNKDTELYGTLKLPLLQEHVEADARGIGEKGLVKIK